MLSLVSGKNLLREYVDSCHPFIQCSLSTWAGPSSPTPLTRSHRQVNKPQHGGVNT